MNKKIEKAIVCDIDGCLLDTSSVFKEIEKQGLTGSKKWDYFNTNANGADVQFNPILSQILEHFSILNYKIILLTARCESIRHQTMFKINNENRLAGLDYNYALYMRKEDDKSKSWESKQKNLEEIKNQYSIIVAIDDDDDNCRMFNRNNILTMKAINREDVPA